MAKQTVVSKGKFVRYTDKDESGHFSYVGKVTKSSSDGISMYIPDVGTLTVPQSDVDKFTTAKRPRKWTESEQPVTTTTKKTAKSKKTKSSKKSKGPSAKLQSVMKIVEQGDGVLTRKQLIAQVVKEVGMTEKGASTYVYNAVKQLGIK